MKTTKFKPGQLVKLNAFALGCIAIENQAFRMRKVNPHGTADFLHSVYGGDPCLIVRVEGRALGDVLVMIHEDVLVQVSNRFMEPFV